MVAVVTRVRLASQRQSFVGEVLEGACAHGLLVAKSWFSKQCVARPGPSQKNDK